MITIKTGKLFVEKYNEENGTNLTPKEILDMLLRMTFKGKRYVVNWLNSPIFQYYIAYGKFIKGKKEEPSFDEGKKEEPSFDEYVSKFFETVEYCPYGIETLFNTYGGCGLGDKKDGGVLAKTEFNYCDNLNFSLDDRYYSFIGSFFQISVNGYFSSGSKDFNTIIDNKDIIWTLYESLKEYIKQLDNNDNLANGQIAKWNGCFLYEKVFGLNEFILNNKMVTKNDSINIEPLNFVEYLELLIKIKKVKCATFERFDKTTITCGYITFDIEGIGSTFSLLKKVIFNVDETFDYKKYSDILLPKRLMELAFENGEVSDDIIDPLYDLKKFRSEKKLSKEYVFILKEYMKLVLNEEELDLIKRFGEFIKSTQNKGGKSLSVKEEKNNLFNSRNGKELASNIIEYCKKVDVDYKNKEGIPFKVTEHFLTSERAKVLGEFLIFTKYFI